jgi:hypothetical protein
MTDRDRTPWYNMRVGGDSSQTIVTKEKLEVGKRKRKIEMIDEIRDIGEKTKEVWDEA